MLFSPSANLDTVVVIVPDTTAMTGEIISLPLNVISEPKKDIYSFQFNAFYDSAVIEALGATTTLSLSALWGSATVNTRQKGVIRIAHAGAYPLQGKGILIYLNFAAKSEADKKSDIIVKIFMFNEGIPLSKIKNGSITVVKKR